MIFMNDSRDCSPDNGQITKTWNEQMNSTQVTIQAVKNSVNKIVSTDPY